MSIAVNEKDRIFKIDTPDTSYICAVSDEPGYLGHVYYGPRLLDDDIRCLLRTSENPYIPSLNKRDKLSFMDCYPMEYPVYGTGDFREPALKIRTREGYCAAELSYAGYRLERFEKGPVPGVYGDNGHVLTIKLKDDCIKLEVLLKYTVFDDCNAVIRHSEIINNGSSPIFLERALSASFDMDNEDYELITLNGSWARERHINRKPIGYGFQGVYSDRGETSHQHQPFLGIVSKDCTQSRGVAIGVNLIYSGNFLASVYEGQFDNLRVMTGINPESFEWKLDPGESFVTPQAALVYSAEGLGGMSRSFHDLYRDHLIRSPWKDKARPVLITNWEATYFDFDEEKLLAIAKEAAACGIEMLVMDDGWFGKRNDDNSSLGDWNVNENKLKGGLKKLVDGVNALGLKFGIWFEPEMISPDSDLYRAHPDWAIAVPGRTAGLARNQYVLDISRSEVRDHVFGSLADILDSANIEYVKWDMNRPLSDLASLGLDAERQKELSHRYVQGVYELQGRLMERYPDLLLENCSGGGARFDAGMLCFSPQIWCSDDTDAIERLLIQEGTALVYPLSTMGAHVSDCPNHTVGRVTPFETRGYVALAGTFGYELDITRIPEADRAMIPGQVKMYHMYHELVAAGDYYRLASYSENKSYDSWMCVSKDKSEALLAFIQVNGRPNAHSRKLKVEGLDPAKSYRIYRFDMESVSEAAYGDEKAYHGSTLANAGIIINNMWGDNKGILLHIKEE